MKLSSSAEHDLAELRAYIAAENPEAADEVAGRLVKAFLLIRDNPAIGRPGTIGKDNREWSPNLPYVIPYKIRADVLYILRMCHTSRARPKSW